MLLTEKSPQEITELRSIILGQSEQIKTQSLRIQQLEEVVRYLRGERFSSSSEKLSEEQLRLFNLSAEESSPKEIKEEKIESYTRKKGGRKPLPEHLERIRIEHDLTPEEKLCPCGCGEMTRIGEEVSEQLDMIPARFRILQNVRFKYACKKCEDGVHIASLPLQIIPKSNATPNLLAYIAVSKFQDALPLHRQTVIFKRCGLDVSRATLANWMIQLGKKVQPLINLAMDHILESSYIGMDETPIQVLREKDRNPQDQSYVWVIRGGPPGTTATLFYYDPSRSQKVLKQITEGFKGYLQSDGYSAYKGLDQNPDIRIVGCFAHARRYFYKVVKVNGKTKTEGVAVTGVDFIRSLYKIEKEIKELSFEQRFEKRQNESKPILAQFKTWLDDVIVKVPPKTLTGEALHYLNAHWKYLIRYIEDGQLEIDNNRVENAIRPFVLGRKNWLFCDSPEGAHAAANLYTLIETAKNNTLEPYHYLSILFHRLPHAQTLDDYSSLLPWNLKKNL